MGYGLRWKHVGKVALIGAGGTACVLLIAAAGISTQKQWSAQSALWLLAGGALLQSIFLLLCVPFALFRVRVRRNAVEHVFAGLVVLHRRPLARFVGTHLAGGRPYLVFEGGERMRLLDVPTDELSRMDADLRAGATVAKAAERSGCDVPPRPVRVSPAWLSCQDGAAGAVAEALAHERELDHLGVLADALEDAGCGDEVLLSPAPARAARARLLGLELLLAARRGTRRL